MSKRKSLLLTAILSLAVNYVSAADVTADFSGSADASPTTKAILDTATTNGTWTAPVLNNLQIGDYFRTLSGLLDFDINSDIGTGDPSANINVTTELSFTTAKSLNGTTVTIDLAQYSRGGAGTGGAYFIGKDSGNKELFKIFLSCGQTAPGAESTTTGLRRGVAYVDQNEDYITVTTSDDVMQNGGVYTVTLGTSGYTYSGDPDTVADDSDKVETPSIVSYNESAINLAKIELVAFNDSARSGMQFEAITISGADYVPTTIATFNGDDTTVNPLTDGSVLTAGTLNGTWSDPVIVNGGAGSDLVPTFGILSNALKFDTFSKPGASATTELTLTDSRQLDGTVVEINLKDMLRAGAGKGGIFVTGKNSGGDDMFKLYFACGTAIPTGLGGVTPTQMGLAYINPANEVVNVSTLTKDLDAGGVITLNLSASSFEIVTDPTTPKDTENPITTVSGIAYNGTGDLKSIEFNFKDENQNTGAIFDNLSIVGDIYVPPVSIAGHALSLTSGSPEITFNHENLITNGQGATEGIADATSGHWTCEFWVKLAATPTVDTLITETASNRLNIGIKTDNTIYLVNNGNTRSSSATVTVGEWTHVAIIGNESSNAEIYINGTSQGNTSGTVNQGFRMSKLNPGNAIGTVGAEIDELRVWTSARTGAEIRANMDKTLEAPYASDLGLYYNFNDLIAVSRATTGKLDELTGNVDGSSNTADSVNSDNSIVVSNAPIYDTLTPAIGFEASQDGKELTWTVADEIGVKQYNITVNGVTTVVMFDAEANGFYSITLDSDAPATITVVDNSGFKQTFLPSDGNIVKAVYYLTEGWNLIAMPGKNADTSAIDSAFWSWNGEAYEMTSAPEVGQAVWVYSATATQVIVLAEKVQTGLELKSGWNMVGPTENMAIPTEAHTVYGWNDTYQIIANEGTLLQGVGYWIFSL